MALPRIHAQKQERGNTKRDINDGKPKTGRLVKHTDYSPKCSVQLCDGKASMGALGGCDDGSDNSLGSLRMAGAAVHTEMGHMKAIFSAIIDVALQKNENAQSFKFARSWTDAQTVLQLPSDQIALCYISYLVADDESACEDLLIGFSALQKLRIDSKTLLETNCRALDGNDFSYVRN